MRLTLEATREMILGFLGEAEDVTFFRTPGNLGDQLIAAGARSLLAGVSYRQLHLRDAPYVAGDVALVCGSGGWCRAHHDMPDLVAPLKERFDRVVILPSSFDLSEPSVEAWIRNTDAVVLARDAASFSAINGLCVAATGLDTSFFFPFEPFRRAGVGVLSAFRTDTESRAVGLGGDNVDISLTCSCLDDWLETIARHEIVRTDRAHVMIAAAMLGKQVHVWEGSYHKLFAIADYAGLAIERMEGAPGQ